MGVLKLQEQGKVKKEVVVTIDGKQYQFPVVVGSEGELALDIAALRSQTGMVTLDPAFMNTASCLSAVTFLDGEEGILRYRGYPIEQLAEKSTFAEVMYLVLNGELPTGDQLNSFKAKLSAHADTPEDIKTLLKSFSKNAHPMGMLSAGLVALSGAFPENLVETLNKNDRQEVIAQLLAQTKNIIAYSHRLSQGKKLIDSNPKLDYCEDFYSMMFGNKADAVISRALNVLLILHADHEQNCSTSAVRLVGSAHANPYAVAASGVNALWGPLHGGANQAVIEMLEQIHQAGGDYKKFITRAKDKNDSFKLMGFGHRVYKNFDPRAKIIKKSCDEILASLGVKDPLLDIAKGLEEEALRDSYFVDRKLYPNVDFYSGIIYKALGIPTNAFTAMFALGRMPGWLAQWQEMLDDKSSKIGRPRQIYTGATTRDYKKK